MALAFTGRSGSSAEFEKLLEAYDGEKRVIVITSAEAIEDFGIDLVQRKAKEKYEAKDHDQSGRVKVLTKDLTR